MLVLVVVVVVLVLVVVVVVVAEVFCGARAVDRRSWQPGSWARWIPGRGFESHRGGLCWSAQAGDPRSHPRTPSSTSASR